MGRETYGGTYGGGHTEGHTGGHTGGHTEEGHTEGIIRKTPASLRPSSPFVPFKRLSHVAP